MFTVISEFNQNFYPSLIRDMISVDEFTMWKIFVIFSFVLILLYCFKM